MTALLAELRRASRGEVVEGLSLSSRTSVRVGGPARFWVKPGDPAALVETLRILSDAAIGWHVLGGGANTIVGDLGIAGAVLRLGADFAPESIEQGGDHAVLTFGAGAPIARLLSLARDQGCVGVAWAAGIPGTVGGLVAMNAGTRAGCMADHLLAVEIATPSGLRWLDAAQLQLGYRRCELPRGAVLTRARCRVRRGTQPELLEEQRAAKADVEKRRATQPLSLPNSGSVFVNPAGDHAGRLIERAGLKGERRGGAQISEKHANFIVNLGGARAADVVELIALARKAVLAGSGIALECEVKLVGSFDPPLPPELRSHHVEPVVAASEPRLDLEDPGKTFLRVQP